jgi:hypothetical protein
VIALAAIVGEERIGDDVRRSGHLERERKHEELDESKREPRHARHR